MSPVWWFPIASILLNILSAAMFAWQGTWVGFFYWLFAAGLTFCVMLGIAE